MPRSFAFFLALATLTATAASAQSVDSAQNVAFAETDSSASVYVQPQAAPVERSAPGAARPQITARQPISGVWLRSAPGSAVQTVSAEANSTELRVDHGVANVTVNHPSENAQILVDLPGGQTALVKDGLYTFNADTNTVRVLHGEAEAFPSGENDHRIKIKDEQQLVFGNGHAKDLNRAEARTDLLPGGFAGDGRSSYHGKYGGYGYGPYGDGFYGGYPYGSYWAYGGYPYWGWGPGWGWGYPYGYGLGFGVGFYGGYGGFRGGFGGFHGGGFRGR